jgi:exodeoxyribonuclease VII small subunit
MAAKKKGFEDHIEDLESVIETLEGDDISLDSAIKEFEKGVKSIKASHKALTKAEGKLTELFENDEDSFIEKKLGLTLEAITGEME